jgi:hypothetical protein
MRFENRRGKAGADVVVAMVSGLDRAAIGFQVDAGGDSFPTRQPECDRTHTVAALLGSAAVGIVDFDPTVMD